MRGYLIALQGYPEWAIGEAVRAFLRGVVKGASTSFCPRPPELAAEVRAKLAHVYAEIDARQKQAAEDRQRAEMIEDRRSSMSEAERMRMGFKMSLLSHSLAFSDGPSRVKAANGAGLRALMSLAHEWQVPVPDGLREAA